LDNNLVSFVKARSFVGMQAFSFFIVIVLERSLIK